MLRLAIANIHRPGALTPSVVMSLGLGLAVLVTITQIDGNLRRQFLAALPERAPSFYFIDIPSHRGRPLRRLPQADTRRNRRSRTCRCCAGASSPRAASRRKTSSPRSDAEWVLQSDRGLTYTGEIPKGSKVVEGEWWGADL